MTFYVENETEETFAEGEVSFSVEDTVEKVATLCWKKAVLMRSAECPAYRQ